MESGGGLVVKLVATNVISICFTLHHLIPYIIIFEIKKNMIVLVHENHDKWPNVTPVQHFCSGFDHANLVSSFHGSKFLTKITKN